jgi:hypothetical protein
MRRSKKEEKEEKSIRLEWAMGIGIRSSISRKLPLK